MADAQTDQSDGEAIGVEEAKRQLAEAARRDNQRLYNEFKDRLVSLKQGLDEHARQDLQQRGYPSRNGIPPIPAYVDSSRICEEVLHNYSGRVDKCYDGTSPAIRSLQRFDAFLVGHVLELMQPNLEWNLDRTARR